MTVVTDYRPTLLRSLQRQRRHVGLASPQAFAGLYLAHHLRLPPSRMHCELFALVAEASANRPRRLAFAAPRGHAKTTAISLAYVLWCALYRKEMFILLVSAAREQAVMLLKAIKNELEHNALLLEDFPEACVPPERRRGITPWKDTQIVLPNGVAIRALGAEQRMRGMKHNQHRPSLIVVDDLEDKEQVASAEQRRKLREWFEGTLLKMSEPATNVVVVGTILHYESLLANLTGVRTSLGQDKISGWETRTYRAIEAPSERPELWERWESLYTGREVEGSTPGPDAARAFFLANRSAMLQGTKVLWGELENYEQLMITRVREGRASFQTEKQNEPVDPAECLFREDQLCFWDDHFSDAAAVVAALGSGAEIYGACDPSLGRRGGNGDFSAIVTIIQEPRTKILYVLAADLALRTPDKTIEHILAYARLYNYREFAVEANGFQQMLVNQLRNAAGNAGIRLSIRETNHSSDKKGRIEALQPLVSQGKIRFSRRQAMLLEQLRQFPLGAHDDGPDALEMAVEMTINRRWESASVYM